jgi:peptidoglycan/LPS O-acetylase OafA/YrhL
LEARIIQAIPYFSIGLLMGLIYKKIEVPTKYISSWWGLTILLIIVLYPNINYYLFYRVIDIWSDVFTYIGISLFFFCWVFLTPKTSKIYSNQFGSYLGMISYSLYLWHLPLLYFFKDLARKEALWFLPIYLILLIIMAFFSYKLIEKPARNIIRKWLIKPIKIN